MPPTRMTGISVDDQHVIGMRSGDERQQLASHRRSASYGSIPVNDRLRSIANQEEDGKGFRSPLAHAFFPHTNDLETRADAPPSMSRKVQLAINASLGVNILLAIAKTYAALSSGSLAVLSSLVDSVLDLASQALFWYSDKRMHTRDVKYPAGRRRLEPIAVIISATLMGMTGECVVYDMLALHVVTDAAGVGSHRGDPEVGRDAHYGVEGHAAGHEHLDHHSGCAAGRHYHQARPLVHLPTDLGPVAVGGRARSGTTVSTFFGKTKRET